MKKITEKELTQVYEDYCETSSEIASDEVRSNYKTYSNALDEYVSALTEDYFKKGFRYAVELLAKGALT